MPTEQPDDNRQTPSYREGLLSSELAERVVSGVAIAVFAFVMVYWSPKAFAALTFLVAAAMSWEWGRIVRGSSPDLSLIHI